MTMLPAAAASKLSQIKQSAMDAGSLVAAIQPAIEKLANEQFKLARDLEPPSDPRRDHLTTEERSAGELQLQLIEAELGAAKRKRAERTKRRDNDQLVVNQINIWLGSLKRDVVIAMAPDVPVEKTGLDGVIDAVAKVRDEISATKAELARIRSAPLPPSTLKKLAADRVAALAAKGAPRFSNAGDVGFDMTWPALAGNVIEVLAWMHGPAMLAAIEHDIDRQFGADTLDVEAKRQKVAEITAELLRLERSEEQLVSTAIAAGLDCERRRNCDARAILGVEVRKVAAVAVAA